MKKALQIAPMCSVHKRFNKANITVLEKIKLGYEIHLTGNFSNGVGAEKSNDDFVEECTRRGIVIHSIPFMRAVHIKNFKLVKQLHRLIEENNFDLIHAHTETGGLLLRLALLGCKTKAKKIYTPHGMSFYKGSSLKSQIMYRFVEKWICTAMDKNIAINEEEFEVLRKWNKKSAEFEHGIGLELPSEISWNEGNNIRKELGLSATDIVITSIGELNKNKNHIEVINALSRLKNKNIYYLICGIGPMEDKISEIAREKGVNLVLLGFRNDISQILAMSDIFTFPSFHEGLPVSVMEAMCAGLPCVVSEIRGNVDLIEEGRGGMLCDPYNDETFAIAISKLICNAGLRMQMGKYNKVKIKSYTMDSVIKEIEKIYTDI